MKEKEQKKYMQKRYNADMKELAKQEKEIAELEKRLKLLHGIANKEKNTLNHIKIKYNLK